MGRFTGGNPDGAYGMLLSESSGGEENGYMDKGTESLHNAALIGLGEGDRITNGRGGR